MASHGCGPGRFACRQLTRRGSAAGARADSSTPRTQRTLPLAASCGRQRRGVLGRICDEPVRPPPPGRAVLGADSR